MDFWMYSRNTSKYTTARLSPHQKQEDQFHLLLTSLKYSVLLTWDNYSQNHISLEEFRVI